MVASIMLERGYGKPKRKAVVDVVHRFAVGPWKQKMPTRATTAAAVAAAWWAQRLNCGHLPRRERVHAKTDGQPRARRRRLWW
jgi:hypothetical protein